MMAFSSIYWDRPQTKALKQDMVLVHRDNMLLHLLEGSHDQPAWRNNQFLLEGDLTSMVMLLMMRKRWSSEQREVEGQEGGVQSWAREGHLKKRLEASGSIRTYVCFSFLVTRGPPCGAIQFSVRLWQAILELFFLFVNIECKLHMLRIDHILKW